MSDYIVCCFVKATEELGFPNPPANLLIFKHNTVFSQII